MAEQFFVNSATPSGSGRFYTELDTNQGKFWYVPQEFVQKGLRKGDNQYLEQSFLNKDYLNTFKPIKLDESLVTKQLKNAGYQDPSTGVLISDADFKKYDKNAGSVTTYKAVDKFAGPVQGIAERDGNLVYSFAGAGGSTYGYLDSKGTPTEVTVTQPKPKFGKIGEIATDVAGAFASIPFLPEIAAALIPGAGPVLYGSLKSLQTAGQGGDLEDVLKSGATAAASALAVKNIIGSPTTSGVEPGVGVEVYPVDAGVTPDITSIPGTPSLPPVDYGLLGDASLPTAAPGMGGGTGITGTPPPLPDAGVLGSTPVDYGLGPQTTPGIDGGVGLQQPTMPNVGGMGGGQGINVPVSGGTVGELGTTPSGATPALGSPDSLINDPSVLGTDVIAQGTPSTISLSDATRALRAASNINNLLNPAEAGGAGGGVDQGGAQQSMAGVDYSGLYNLLAQRAIAGGLLGTRYQPQPVNLASLLG
jgi:hypothetical protein